MLRPDWTQSGIWIGYGFWKFHIPTFQATKSFSCLDWKVSESWFVFHPVCVLNTKQYCIINLGEQNRISSSQATFMGFFTILYSLRWSRIVFGAQIQFGDIFSTHKHHWLSRKKQSLKLNKRDKDCNYCWNMNMFKDTVEDAVCYIFHGWNQANFWTQGAIHIRGL